MNLHQLEVLFLEAKRLTGHSEFVVIGSLSILGVVHRAAHVPERMLASIDVDCYTKADPARIFELADALGEGSSFDEQHGYYLDPVAPNLPTLPAQWSYRLVKTELDDSITIYFLDPNDAAVSKYARGDVRDREWIQAGLAAGLRSASIIASRFSETEFMDDPERDRAWAALNEDTATDPD
jgi:hypothetical protein